MSDFREMLLRLLVLIRKELLAMSYDGLWKIKYDEHGEEIINFDVVHMTRGGKIAVSSIEAR